MRVSGVIKVLENNLSMSKSVSCDDLDAHTPDPYASDRHVDDAGTDKVQADPEAKARHPMHAYINTKLSCEMLGTLVPRRRGRLSKWLAHHFYRLSGWQTKGQIPNVSQAVLIGAPHTSNLDGLYAIPMVLDLDLDVRILAKKELFYVPLLARFLRWAGVMPIDRHKKGSVLQANIERFLTGEPLFLALAPEGTRGYTDSWKTGFYYLALGAGVPIIPVVMDYATKEVRFLPAFYPTGDIEWDLPQIYAYFVGVVPKHPKCLSKPLKDLQE